MDKPEETTLLTWTFLIFELTSLVDKELHQGVSIKDVGEQLANRTLFDWLGEKYPFPPSEFKTAATWWRSDEMQEKLLGWITYRKRRTEENGICALLEACAHIIQSEYKGQKKEDSSEL